MNDDVWQAPGPATPGQPSGGEREQYRPVAPPPQYGSAEAFATPDRHRERVLGGPGYSTPAYRNDPVAVTSLVLGIVGIVVPLVFLLAIGTGHLALRRLRRSYEGGRGLAVAGLVLGYVTFALWASVLLLGLVLDASAGF